VWTVAFIMWNCAKSWYILLVIVQVSLQHCVVIVLVCCTVSWLLQVCDMWQMNSDYNRWMTVYQVSYSVDSSINFWLRYYHYCVLSASILVSPARWKDCWKQRKCGIVKHAYEHGFIHGTCENMVLVLTSAMTILDFSSRIVFLPPLFLCQHPTSEKDWSNWLGKVK